MAFLDKVSSVAKDIAGGAKNVAGNAVISIKISGIEHEISELKFKLGEAVWAFHSCKSEEGLNPHDEIENICTEIQAAYDRIDALNADRDKQDDADAIVVDSDETDSEGEVRICHECGAVFKNGWCFCPVCGEKYPEKPDDTSASCEERAAKNCAKCGAELTDLQNFCPICGTKR